MKDTGSARAIRMLHPLVLIFSLVLLAGALTYVVPAGEFERAKDAATGREIVVAGSYHRVDPNPVDFGTFVMSINDGIVQSGSFFSLLLLTGGAFGVVMSTGVVSALMPWIVRKFKSDKSRGVLIVLLIAFFQICAATTGFIL